MKLLHRSNFYSEPDYSSGDLRLRASEFMSWLVCREVKEAWDRSMDLGLHSWTVAQYAQHHPSRIHPEIQVELPSYHSHQLKLQWPNTPVLCKAFSCYNPKNKASFWEHYFTKFLCCLVWGLVFFLIGILRSGNYFYFYVSYPIFCSILFHNKWLFQLLEEQHLLTKQLQWKWAALTLDPKVTCEIKLIPTMTSGSRSLSGVWWPFTLTIC